MAFAVKEQEKTRPDRLTRPWKPSDSLAWLSDPSWFVGATSIFDVFGSATWYDPARLTETGSRYLLNYDMYRVAKDFWKAMNEEADEEGLDRVWPNQIRLFDPDAF